MSRFCFVLTAAVLAIASVPAPASAQRNRAVDNLFRPKATKGPAETVEAADPPLDTRRAPEKLAALLRAFEPESPRFTYTLQLVAEEDTFRLYQVTFPSPLKTPWPENNVVPAELYVPSGASASKRVPAAVVLDIMDGSAILPRMMARSAAQNGLAALYVPMPCYNDRRPAGDAHKLALREDPARAADGLRQTVMDVRRAKAILGSRPEVDATRLGITGISLGGIMTSLCAGVDAQVARGAPIRAGGDAADITFHAHETSNLRPAMDDNGMGRAEAARVFAPVEPIAFASRVRPERCLMINAANDEVIPKKDTEALHRALGRPQIVWLQAGHYSSLTFFPLMQKTVIEFLRDGKRPEEGKPPENAANAPPAP
jgi:dienelactone hydrolase